MPNDAADDRRAARRRPSRSGSPRRNSRRRRRNARGRPQAFAAQQQVLTKLARSASSCGPTSATRASSTDSPPRSTRAPSRCSSRCRRWSASTRCAPRIRRPSRRRCSRRRSSGRRAVTARTRTARLRRARRHDRAARHGRRRRASVPARQGAPGDRPRRPRRRRDRAREPARPAQLERHGTELAGILVGAGGPAGLHGVAPGATILPIRVAGWQPGCRRARARLRRSDQLIAGLDRAVDPNGDGDAHDAVRVALVGVVEPYAAFADGPEAQAVQGALDLNTVVVTPAGNDGAAGPSFGSVAGPAGAPAALAVGATDARARAAARPRRPPPRARRDPRPLAAAPRCVGAARTR